MQRKVWSRAKFAGKGPRGSRSQIVGFAMLSQLSTAEVAVWGFRSADIVVTEPRTLQVVVRNVALDQQIIAPRAAQGVRPVTGRGRGAV